MKRWNEIIDDKIVVIRKIYEELKFIRKEGIRKKIKKEKNGKFFI